MVITLSASARRPIPVKETELPELNTSAEHIFEAEFVEHQQTYYHRNSIIKGDELAAYLKLKDAEHKDIIFTYLRKDGTRYTQEYMSKFQQANDPFAEEIGSNKPKVVDALYKLKNSKFEFSFYKIQIRDRITLKISKSIKGLFKLDTEQDFDFYRGDAKVCWFSVNRTKWS